MAKQTFTTGQVLTAAQLTSLQQTAMSGGAASAKTASYTLVAADAGTAISMTSTSATTITVNTGLFAAGDTVFIQNLGTGNLTITAGTATVNTAGSLILPQYDAGLLYFVSASSAVFYDYIQVGATSPLTTKGDLYGFSTSDARIPVGANDTVLTADSTQTLGVKWATPSSGGMTLISETVASSLTSLSFSSLGSYKQLLLIWNGINTSNNTTTFNIRFNNDSGSNYSTAQMGSGGINNMGSGTDLGANLQNSFVQDCTSTTLGDRGRGYWLIDNYTSTTKYKTAYGQIAYKEAQYNTKMHYISFSTYESQSAVTSIDIVRTTGTGSFSNATNTTIRLYGIS